MLIVDRLIISGVKFVLGKVASAVEAELDDDAHLREELLAAQMQLELGELGEDEFAAIETDVLARLRAISERRRAAAAAERGDPEGGGELRVTGASATVEFGHREDER